MTGGFFHGKGLQKGIIVISNPTSLLDRRDNVTSSIKLLRCHEKFFFFLDTMSRENKDHKNNLNIENEINNSHNIL
jgi:hypothetical protein